MLRLGPIHPSFRACLEAALRQTDLTRLLHTSETPANVLIPVVVCSLANHSGIAELKERLQEQLFACARHLAEFQHFDAASLTDDEARILGGALRWELTIKRIVA